MIVLREKIPAGARVEIAACIFIAVALVFAITGSARGDASAPAASFTAQDYAWSVTGSSETTAHIDPGQSVAFAYPSGGSTHNADFGSLPPSSCTQLSGTDSGSVPPLPHTFTAPPWSGSCTFDVAGTYQFHCDLHPFMHGTIVVGSTAGGGTNEKNSLSSTDLRVAKTQHSKKVRGSVEVKESDSTLTLDIFASAKSLGGSGSKLRRIAHFSRASLPAANASFAVAVNSAARAALKRQSKLSVRLNVQLTDAAGTPTNATRKVVLKP
jgi:plastocyanin